MDNDGVVLAAILLLCCIKNLDNQLKNRVERCLSPGSVKDAVCHSHPFKGKDEKNNIKSLENLRVFVATRTMGRPMCGQ